MKPRELPILKEVRACTVCAPHLPNEPRPVLQAAANARVLIIGQAPGRVAHETGVPWNDVSGDRLRTWLRITRETFYNVNCFALVPMGFCYPGTGKGGDLPPRPECAPLWQEAIVSRLKQVQLTVLVGSYSIMKKLGPSYDGVSHAVQHQPLEGKHCFVLPHPSPRNTIWIKQRPWFEQTVLPRLASAVHMALS